MENWQGRKVGIVPAEISEPRPRPFSFARYLLHCTLAFAVCVISIVLVSWLDNQSRPGWIGNSFFRYSAFRLYSIPMVILAGITGAIANRLGREAKWIWIPAAVVLVGSVVKEVLGWSDHSASSIAGLVWNTFFGRCGGDECFTAIFVAAPCTAIFAYSLAACFNRRRARN